MIHLFKTMLKTFEFHFFSKDGYTPLHFPASYGRIEMCTVLLKGGSDPNIKAEVTYDIKQGGFDLGIKLQRDSSCPVKSNITLHCEV